MELPPPSELMDVQGWQFLTVPPFTRLLEVVCSQMPWLVQLVALTVETVVPLLPETLKKPRPQLLEVAVPRVVLRLLLATRKPA